MLVNCVAYQDGHRLADIRKDEISDYVAKPDCFVWVALRDPEPAEMHEMQVEFDLGIGGMLTKCRYQRAVTRSVGQCIDVDELGMKWKKTGEKVVPVERRVRLRERCASGGGDRWRVNLLADYLVS